jgi:subtilisin family serine protease
MTKVPVIIEFQHSRSIEAAASVCSDTQLKANAVPDIDGVSYDKSFAPTPVPALTVATGLSMADAWDDGVESEIDPDARHSTYVVRAEIEEKDCDKIASRKGVAGVYADVRIQPALICPGSPPLGDDGDVERLLCVPALQRAGADGSGVLVAIVDTGINMAYLNSKGKNPGFDAARSWVPRPGLVPGSLPVGHGTMCAFDACIAAPKCTLLDIALLQSTASGGSIMDGFLSDAVRAYSHLLAVMAAPRRPGETRSLVVNNSWGMFHPSWDFPVGHSGNYSDNPNHPFNRIVGTLARAGADILFAAGNCGSNCPDGRCQGVTSNAIYGANGHPSVLCVAGVDTTKQRVGYSSQGPGRLSRNKPDLSGYTHFRGSGVYSADGGTSAATPVVAGVVAAWRSKRPYDPGNPSVSPSAVRNLFRSTAEDLGTAGYDFDHGHGVVNGCELSRRLRRIVLPDLCRRYPWLCRPRPVPIDLCKRYPWLCRKIPRQPIPRLPIPPVPPRPRPLGAETSEADYGILDLGANPEMLESLDIEDLAELLYYAGLHDAQEGSAGYGGPASGPGKHPDGCKCGCGCKG